MESLKPYGLGSANIGSVVGDDFTQADFMSWLQNQNRMEEESTDSSENQWNMYIASSSWARLQLSE